MVTGDLALTVCTILAIISLCSAPPCRGGVRAGCSTLRTLGFTSLFFAFGVLVYADVGQYLWFIVPLGFLMLGLIRGVRREQGSASLAVSLAIGFGLSILQAVSLEMYPFTAWHSVPVVYLFGAASGLAAYVASDTANERLLALSASFVLNVAMTLILWRPLPGFFTKAGLPILALCDEFWLAVCAVIAISSVAAILQRTGLRIQKRAV